jgi:hypothetical protein
VPSTDQSKEAIDEQSRLSLAALLESQGGGGFYGINGGKRGDQVALFPASVVAGSRKDRRVLLRRSQLLIAFASPGRWLACDLTCESHGAFQQIAFDQLVHDSGLQRVWRLDRIAIGAHPDGLGDARKPRQALRACGSGNQAEFHFRLSDLGARRSPQ